MTGSNSQGCTLSHNYLFKNQVEVKLSENDVGIPDGIFANTKMQCGFKKQMIHWERKSDRPVYMTYSITLKDGHGNSARSNVEHFTIEYDFYEPTEE